MYILVPLAAILSNSQAAQRLIARGPTQVEKLRVVLADIVKSDRRAGDVIRRIRARLKRDDDDERAHVALDVNDVVREVLAIVRNRLRQR